MNKMFTSPSCYIQGKDTFKTELAQLKKFGTTALLITDELMWELVGQTLAKNLTNHEVTVTKAIFSGETTKDAIQEMLVKAEKCEFVIALGGGKAIDTGKAAAFQLDLPLAVLPTAASMDGPTSRIAVLYDENGIFEKYTYYPRNPDLVLVDTQVIANGPVSLLVAGIGDALSTYIEARSVWRAKGVNTLGKAPTLAAYAIAEKCQVTLFEKSAAAIAANQQHVVTPAFEEVVEANLLLSGLGFESGGLSLAHALHNALALVSGPVQKLSHGEKVTFTTLVQLVIENAPLAELDRYLEFCQKLGLPTTLAEMKLDKLSKEELLEIGEYTLRKQDSAKGNEPNLTAEMVASGILALDQYVKNKSN